MGNGCGNGMGDLYFVWKRFCVKRGRWWKMTGKRSLVRLWKIGVMGLTVGLCVGFISPADCFASELMRGIEQRKGQVEVTRGDLPEITGDVEKGNVNGDIGADWEEDFTDTSRLQKGHCTLGKMCFIIIPIQKITKREGKRNGICHIE